MAALRFDAGGVPKAEHGKEELNNVLEEDEAGFEPRQLAQGSLSFPEPQVPLGMRNQQTAGQG